MTSAGPQLLLELQQVAPRIRTVKSALSLPRAKRRGPVSSKLAAEELAGSAPLEANLMIVLALVRKYPGKTSRELAQYGPLDRYEIGRRLPELRTINLVVSSSELRKCGISGKRCHVWQAINAKGECQ